MTRLPRWRRDLRVSLLVLCGMTAFVALTYVVIVLGGGALLGHTSSPLLVLSVLATSVVALSFEPLQVWMEQRSERLVHGGRVSPYEALSRFSEAVTGPAEGDELPIRMARLLAVGTGAQWAQVWLRVNERPVLAGSWPLGAATTDVLPADGPEEPGYRSLEVSLAGEQLGLLRLREQDRHPLTLVEERLFAGLAAQSGLVLHGARLRAELAERLEELSVRSTELRLSRERLVDAQDAERRRLERDIHDGAQQHLVALAVNLRLAETLASTAPERAIAVLSEQAGATRTAIQTLVDLSQGIYPSALTEAGVGPALRSATATTSLPVSVADNGVGRLPQDIETAIYFCCLEAVQNAAKHSGASRVDVTLTRRDALLQVEIVDDGCGFEPESVAAGGGLSNMRDRIDSAGGQLDVARVLSGGTKVRAVVPVSPPARRA